jgi:diacylglycerol O-acyltransferase / wax synthase
MTGRRAVGPVDTLWLRADRPENLMVIDAVLWLDAPVDVDRLRVLVARRIVDRFPVFHQRLAVDHLPLAPRQWEDDPEFSLDHHIRVVALSSPADEDAIAAYVESQMHVAFDMARPLWEMHVLQGFEGGSAIVARFHHAIADGIALVQVLLSLTDETPDGDLMLEEDVEEPARTFAVPGLDLALKAAGQATRLLRPSVVSDAFTLVQQTAHIADKLLLRSLPPSPVLGEPGIPKRAVWSQPHRLSDIKRIGRTAGATVNDVLVAAVSGAVAVYVDEHGGDAMDLTTMVPVNLRDLDKPLPRELGNKFALAMLPLPSGIASPRARLAAAKQRMDAIKSSPEAIITFGIINAIGFTNRNVENVLVNFFSGKAIGVTTNVMGPITGRYLAGARVVGALGWVPGSGKQTVGVCIFSYDDTVRVGFKTDATIVPDAERLVEAFDAEIDELARLTRASH